MIDTPPVGPLAGTALPCYVFDSHEQLAHHVAGHDRRHHSRSGRPWAEGRAGTADRQHAGGHLSRTGPNAPRGGARLLQRRHVQPRRIPGPGARTAAKLPPLDAGAPVQVRSTCRRRTSSSPTGSRRPRSSTSIAAGTRRRFARPAASTCNCWASAATGTSASTSRSAPATAAPGSARSTRSRGATRPAISSAKRTCRRRPSRWGWARSSTPARSC